jgi:hypothetical protein
MTLHEIMIAAKSRVCGGTEYQWQCYGPDARYIDFSDTDGTEYSSVVFDTKNQTVYELAVYVPGYDQAFIWRHSDFEQAYISECQTRNIEPNIAWDNLVYKVVDQKTILEYVKDVGETYYDNLPIPAEKVA